MRNEIMQEAAEKRESKRKWFAVLLLLLLLIMAGGYAGMRYYNSVTAKEPDRVQQEFDVKYGMLPNKTPEEIRKLLDQTMSEGMVNIVVNSNPVFDKKSMKGNINIEKRPANKYCQQVDIVLEETGEVLASSGMIEPGQYVDYVTLNRTLEEGDYAAKAVFTTCYPDGNHEVLAVNNFELNLSVR